MQGTGAAPKGIILSHSPSLLISGFDIRPECEIPALKLQLWTEQIGTADPIAIPYKLIKDEATRWSKRTFFSSLI